MAMTRLSDPTPRMTLPRALLSEALRLARSPLTAVHLVCGLAAGLACGEYFSVTRWDPALGADAYAQFLGALMPLMSAIVCGLAVGSDYLPAFTAAALLALSVKNFARSFCNGYGFDAIFRASLYLGLLPFVSTAALPLLLILPPAVLLFRRTLARIVKIPLFRDIFHGNGAVLVPLRRPPLHQKAVPCPQAVQPLMVIFNFAAGLINLLQKKGLKTVHILARERLADLFQPETLINQITDHLHPLHGAHAVVAIMTGFCDVIRSDQPHFFIIAQHTLGHIADFAHLADGIQRFLFHTLPPPAAQRSSLQKLRGGDAIHRLPALAF